MILAWPPKEVHEHLDYEVDFTARLAEGEVVVSRDAVVEFGTVVITSITGEEGHTVVWMQGGIRNELARIRCTLETNTGRTLTLTPILPIV